jgi:hypothetical protein
MELKSAETREVVLTSLCYHETAGHCNENRKHELRERQGASFDQLRREVVNPRDK